MSAVQFIAVCVLCLLYIAFTARTPYRDPYSRFVVGRARARRRRAASRHARRQPR
jgi:hypothetical protein